MKVGVFDSGIGGLTVLRQLINDFPNNEYVYYGDTLNLPYGTKCISDLRSCADKVVDFLMAQKVDIIVIACGTVSSNLYNEIKDSVNIPVVDVLLPTIKYIRDNNFNNVGIFATPMTIESGAFNEVVSKSLSCPLFVPLIENGEIETGGCDEVVLKYLNDLGKCDYIILGCTHYPLLSKVISKYTDAELIDMGKCVSRYINITNDGKQKVSLYFSLVSDSLLKNVSEIIDVPYELIFVE